MHYLVENKEWNIFSFSLYFYIDFFLSIWYTVILIKSINESKVI